MLLSNLNANGEGFEVRLTADQRVETMMADNQTSNLWKCDGGRLKTGKNHVSINLDGGPKIISYIINGAMNDGGSDRQFGWGRFSRNLFHINSGEPLRVDGVRVSKLFIYNRILTTSEAIGNSRSV